MFGVNQASNVCDIGSLIVLKCAIISSFSTILFCEDIHFKAIMMNAWNAPLSQIAMMTSTL